MNVLFLTIGRMESIEARSLYPDLLRQFRDRGHEVYAVSPRERRTGLLTEVREEKHVHLLYVSIGNLTKCNLIEKGISTVMVEQQFRSAICKYFGEIKFDLVLYSTPPITLAGVVEYIKKRDGAKTYLLLKDIFPQNSVDLGMLSKTGLQSVLYHYFRQKERKLYALSDRIGCMSPANCAFVLKHNPEVSPDKVDVFPNCIDPQDLRVTAEEKLRIRKKYDLPLKKRIFVYGGNLGKPQDVPFIIECLKACASMKDVYFVIAGSGTDRKLLEDYVKAEHPSHVRLFEELPKAEYDRMIACCDVGLIFLDHRFTIPNFPSRLLSYMQAGLPVLACTDVNTDIGRVITEGGFGWWCESNSVDDFCRTVTQVQVNGTEISAEIIEILHRDYSVAKNIDKILVLLYKGANS